MTERDIEDIDLLNFPELDKEVEANERVENSPLARLLRNKVKSSVENR